MAQSAELLQLEPRPREQVDRLATELEERLARRLPRSVRSLLGYEGLLEALARTYDSHPELSRGQLLTPAQVPGVRDDVLWLMTENQGVAVWGVPLEAGEDPPVVVGGDLWESGSPTQYAANLDTFAFSWAWDQQLLRRTPLVQAQAPPLDRDIESILAARFERGPTTWGWPCHRNLRFGTPTGVSILLWACAKQCDWWISGPDPESVEQCIRVLLPYSELRAAFWSNDDSGIALLARITESA